MNREIKIHDFLEEQRLIRQYTVKVDYFEVEHLAIQHLIRIRNDNKDVHEYFDKTLRFFLTEEEFEKYVKNPELLTK
jgi:hypothetical protein